MFRTHVQTTEGSSRVVHVCNDEHLVSNLQTLLLSLVCGSYSIYSTVVKAPGEIHKDVDVVLLLRGAEENCKHNSKRPRTKTHPFIILEQSLKMTFRRYAELLGITQCDSHIAGLRTMGITFLGESNDLEKEKKEWLESAKKALLDRREQLVICFDDVRHTAPERCMLLRVPPTFRGDAILEIRSCQELPIGSDVSTHEESGILVDFPPSCPLHFINDVYKVANERNATQETSQGVIDRLASLAPQYPEYEHVIRECTSRVSNARTRRQTRNTHDAL